MDQKSLVVVVFFSKVGEMKKFDGEPRFGLLFKLMSGLLSIPCSNADSKRGFSMLRKILISELLLINQQLWL